MNYFISGSSGFIGTAIKNHLLLIGEDVYTIPRNQSIEELTRLFNYANPDYIMHLATYGNHYDNQKDFKKMVDVNIFNTYNLLEAAKAFNYKIFYNFTATSISGEYYYITKHCAEMLASRYDKVVNIRPYSVYGPMEANHKLVPTIIRHLNSGEQMTLTENATHAWIFVDDLVRALFEGNTELGGSIKVPNIDMVKILESISGKKLNYIPSILRSYDNNNWQAPEGICYTTLREGLKQTYEYFTR